MTISVHLIVIGKNKDKSLQNLIDDYLRRMSWKMSMIEIPAPNVSDAERKSREAELIREALPARAALVILDERGENTDSVSFAQKIEQIATHQSPNIAFIIGGADGIEAEFRKTAHWVVSFGKLTWPHMMVRLMLVEQLYRASTILAGHPYHRT